MAVATATKIGKVVQVIGPVVDIEFADGHLPEIYNAVRVTGEAGSEKIDIIVEVEQHLGENRVRTVAMKPTDGLQRGMTAEDQGGPISMPVGPEHARARAERARRAGGLPGSARGVARSAGRSTGPLRRSRISPPS